METISREEAENALEVIKKYLDQKVSDSFYITDKHDLVEYQELVQLYFAVNSEYLRL